MRVRNEEEFQNKKIELMEKAFDCYAQHGLHAIGIKGLAGACGCTSANLYTYFADLDELIVQSTAYCMRKVEDDFMALAPRHIGELEQYIDEIPYWTAKKHGQKYRLMYQVYTCPKYQASGREFFREANQRYAGYAALLEGSLGIPGDVLTPLIFLWVRACVHYALFGDECYLQSQLGVVKKDIRQFLSKSNALLKEEKV